MSWDTPLDICYIKRKDEAYKGIFLGNLLGIFQCFLCVVVGLFLPHLLSGVPWESFILFCKPYSLQETGTFAAHFTEYCLQRKLALHIKMLVS